MPILGWFVPVSVLCEPRRLLHPGGRIGIQYVVRLQLWFLHIRADDHGPQRALKLKPEVLGGACMSGFDTHAEQIFSTINWSCFQWSEILRVVNDISRLSHPYLPLWIRTCHLLDFCIQGPTPRIPLQLTPRPEQRDLPLCRQWWYHGITGWSLCSPELCCRAVSRLVASSHRVGTVPQHQQCILLGIISLQPVRVSACHRRRIRFKLARRECLSGEVARTNIGVDEVDGFAFVIL
jgi:hypothetical protein